MAFSPLPWSLRGRILILCCYFSGEYGCNPGWGGLSSHPLPPRILAPGPLAQLLPAKKPFGLYLTSHVPCAVSRLSHLCPAFQLVFKSLGCLLGCPLLPGSPLVMSGILQGKATWGKDRKDKKINFHWPSGEPRVFARKLWWLCVVCGGSRLEVGVGTGALGLVGCTGGWAWAVSQGCCPKSLTHFPKPGELRACAVVSPHGAQHDSNREGGRPSARTW